MTAPPSKRDRKMAIEVTYAYEHGKPERPSLEHHIAEALAQARAEGFRAGIEAAAVVADGMTLSREACQRDGGCRHATCVVARQCAAAIRALAEKQP